MNKPYTVGYWFFGEEHRNKELWLTLESRFPLFTHANYIGVLLNEEDLLFLKLKGLLERIYEAPTFFSIVISNNFAQTLEILKSI